MNPSLEVLFSRRSIRAYKNSPVSKEEISDIIKAGMAAPSGISRRAWHITVISDPALRQAIAATSTHRSCCSEVPYVLLVSGDSNRYLAEPRAAIAEACWPQDCAAMVENMLIAANGLGLGSLWMGVYPGAESMNSLRELLSLPQHIMPFALVAIGHRGEEKEARTTYEEEKVLWR